ncbi:PREDICTED: uncharacterized protein LOC106740927 isoform X1 [Dinoponera quadriceps]|uniref:Uncharacterized protein LOC106740927 isoform X1 n=1 Tax=Dinoponera quadriceps TaxID=609295 RepID=A0A6P3WQ39_DINQU|nr:PREDICTED: uncharacterized protein LOC106740927 isoform X1 [Dinoponera quadriceps]XP_014467893.1 PREDICTED: uncharacterized protein LOC106740927 isoform X1 [Dinoponera quadriceps]XP_014467894.1 PREDICTED: uncharacterized protein LOC106740927 isoform X1 [Dinoponera quadriceps]
MAKLIFIALCCVCLLLLESANSLKCQTGIQQADDQFRKVVQICKKRHSGGNNSDSSSNEDDDDSDLLNKFFMKGSDSSSNTQSWKHGNDQRGSSDPRHSFNQTNGNWRSAQRPNHDNNNHDSDGMYPGRGYPSGGYPGGNVRDGSSYDQMNGNFGNTHKDQKRACVTQCFFNELNAVSGRLFRYLKKSALPVGLSIILILTGGSQRIPPAGIDHKSDDTQHTESRTARFYGGSHHRVFSLPQCRHEAGQVLLFAKSLVLLGRKRKRKMRRLEQLIAPCRRHNNRSANHFHGKRTRS